MKPIEKLMSEVEWTEVAGDHPGGSGLPYATHRGEIELFGRTLRVYRLNDGRAIVNADDISAMFETLAG